jgi:hypothetical protein
MRADQRILAKARHERRADTVDEVGKILRKVEMWMTRQKGILTKKLEAARLYGKPSSAVKALPRQCSTASSGPARTFNFLALGLVSKLYLQ